MRPTTRHTPAEPGPDFTLLDDQEARRLLTPAMEHPTRVWAYASAATEPGAAPVDEILLTETTGSKLGVVWVCYPGSFTGTIGHLLGGIGHDYVSLLRSWERAVFELADLVESHAARTSPTEALAQLAYMQAKYLRWTACYGLLIAMSNHARDQIRDAIRDQPGGFTQDLGDLSPDGTARLADNAERGPANLIPPGWDLTGWDHTRTRTHPILSGLRS